MSLSPEIEEIIEDPTTEAPPLAEDFVEPEPERTAPERIGRYELCFELASGGMASVYLARIDGASGFEKLIALKRIHRHLAEHQGHLSSARKKLVVLSASKEAPSTSFAITPRSHARLYTTVTTDDTASGRFLKN